MEELEFSSNRSGRPEKREEGCYQAKIMLFLNEDKEVRLSRLYHSRRVIFTQLGESERKENKCKINIFLENWYGWYL